MLRLILFSCFFTLSLYASQHTSQLASQIELSQIISPCENPNSFTQEQKQVLLRAYTYAKNTNFKWVLPAIAWQESCAGSYLVNFKDPSAGAFHAHIPNVLKKYTKLKDTSLNRNLMGQYLIQNFDFSLKVAMDELNFWDRSTKNNFKDTIKSYNKGGSWRRSRENNSLAEHYYSQIMEKIQILKTYLPTIENNNMIEKTFDSIPSTSPIPAETTPTYTMSPKLRQDKKREQEEEPEQKDSQTQSNPENHNPNQSGFFLLREP